jgi:hypothetical protein
LRSNSPQLRGAAPLRHGSKTTPLTDAFALSGHGQAPKPVDEKGAATINRIATLGALIGDRAKGVDRPQSISRAAYKQLSAVKASAENLQRAEHESAVQRMPSGLLPQLTKVSETARKAQENASRLGSASSIIRACIDNVNGLAEAALGGEACEQRPGLSGAVQRTLQTIATNQELAPPWRRTSAGLRPAIAKLAVIVSRTPEPIPVYDFASEAAEARACRMRMAALLAKTAEPQPAKSEDTPANVAPLPERQATPDSAASTSTAEGHGWSVNNRLPRSDQPASVPPKSQSARPPIEQPEGEAIASDSDQKAQPESVGPPRFLEPRGKASGFEDQEVIPQDPEQALPALSSSAEIFLDHHKAGVICVTRSSDGTYRPHDDYRRAWNFKAEEFGDLHIQRELKERFDQQERFLQQALPFLVKTLDHKSIKGDPAVLRSLPQAYRDTAKAWLATPFAQRIRSRALSEGQKMTRLAIHDWQDTYDEGPFRFNLALRAQNWQWRWPNSLDGRTLKALRADAERARASAKMALNGSSGDGDPIGTFRHPANQSDDTIISASDARDPISVNSIQEEIDDWIDEQFDHQQGSSSRALGDAKGDTKRVPRGVSLSERGQGAMTVDEAAFCRSTITHLVKNVDAKAVDAGDEAIVAKLPLDQQDEARKWIAHYLWQLLLQRLREVGKRRTDTAINQWQAENRANSHRRFETAWQAQRQWERWPTDLAAQTRQNLADHAAKHQALLNQQAMQQQQRGR